jgi:hypothetical protein
MLLVIDEAGAEAATATAGLLLHCCSAAAHAEHLPEGKPRAINSRWFLVISGSR